MHLQQLLRACLECSYNIYSAQHSLRVDCGRSTCTTLTMCWSSAWRSEHVTRWFPASSASLTITWPTNVPFDACSVTLSCHHVTSRSDVTVVDGISSMTGALSLTSRTLTRTRASTGLECNWSSSANTSRVADLSHARHSMYSRVFRQTHLYHGLVFTHWNI